jgi:hypothetical protein
MLLDRLASFRFLVWPTGCRLSRFEPSDGWRRTATRPPVPPLSRTRPAVGVGTMWMPLRAVRGVGKIGWGGGWLFVGRSFVWVAVADWRLLSWDRPSWYFESCMQHAIIINHCFSFCLSHSDRNFTRSLPSNSRFFVYVEIRSRMVWSP